MNAHVNVYQSDDVPGVVMPNQAHTSLIQVVLQGEGVSGVCDALVTTNPRIVIGVHTRDCAPICFGDGTKVAVAHVGWRGLCSGIVENALEHFDDMPDEIFVGPFLHSFEIQRDHCYEAIVRKFGERFLFESEGKLVFNFKDAITSLLPNTVAWDGRNTENDLELPSHRHKRTLGYIVTTVSLQDETQ